MPAKEAKPDRYVVDRIGTPDREDAAYFVLDIAHDPDAREALAYLGNKYRQHKQLQLAQECFDALDAALPTFVAMMEARYPRKK